MGRGLAYLVDEGLGKRDPALLDRAVLATAMIAVVLAFGSYLRTSMVNKIGEMVLADIRRAIFGHAITLSAGWFENARTGDVLSRITTDTSIVQTVMTSTLSMAARNFLLLIGGLGNGGSVQPENVACCFGGGAVGGSAADFHGATAAHCIKAWHKTGLPMLGLRPRKRSAQSARFRPLAANSIVKGNFERAVDLSLVGRPCAECGFEGLLSGIVIFLVFSGIGVILWIGGQDLMAGRISAGDLSSFHFLCVSWWQARPAFYPSLPVTLQRAAGAAERIAQLLDTEASLPDASVAHN